jgi:peptidoglycan/LPS O-acetylase OafA/YrhL
VLEQLAIIGPIGVGFFFVLSGFVLTWSWRPATSVGAFWFNRVARIYPLHILLTITAVAIAVGEAAPHWAGAIASAFLVQSWLTDRFRDGGNVVSWSLSCEAFFYACFPFLAPLMTRWPTRRALAAIPWILAAMVTYTAVYAVVLHQGHRFAEVLSTYTNPAYRIGEFLVGMCLAVAIRGGFRVRVRPVAALVVAASAYALLAAANWAVSRTGLNLGGEDGLPLGVLDLMYLPFSALLVGTLASSDVEGVGTHVSGRWHVKLGEWSFALYLVQMILIERVIELLPSDMRDPAAALALVCTMALCIAAAAALHEFFEAPINLKLRSLWKGRSMRPEESTTRARS